MNRVDMRVVRLLGLLVGLQLGGCAKWAYTPTWKGGDRVEGVVVSYDTTGVCGELAVANRTDQQLRVIWSEIRSVLPSGQKNPTRLYVKDGEVRSREVVPPGGKRVQGVCLTSRTFVVKPRPLTAYDLALGWYFGLGVLAGNVAWKPSDAKRNRVIDHPRAYGFELLVPVRDDDGAWELRLEVRGDGVSSFKYNKRVHGRPRPLPTRTSDK